MQESASDVSSRTEEEEEEESRFISEDLDGEVGIEGGRMDSWQVGGEEPPTSAADEELAEKLLFYLRDLGGPRQVNGVEVYIVSELAEQSLRGLLAAVRDERGDKPKARARLLKWGVVAQNLVPLILVQADNKPVLLRALILTAMMTEPLEPGELAEIDDREGFLRGLSEALDALVEQKLVTALVKELADCVETPVDRRTPFHKDAEEALLALIRNILCGEDQRRHEPTRLARAAMIFAEPRGVFDALVFLSQRFDAESSRLADYFIQSFAALASAAPIDQLFGDSFETEQLKRLRTAEKLRAADRKIRLASERHSRFGASYVVRDQFQHSKTFSSLREALDGGARALYTTRAKNKIVKPRPRRQIAGLASSQVVAVDKKLRDCLKSVLLDFLEHSSVAVLTEAMRGFSTVRPSPAMFRRTFEIVGLGVRAAAILSKSGRQCSWLPHCLQFGLLDMFFTGFATEASKKIREVDPEILIFCTKLLGDLLGAAEVLAAASNSGRGPRSAVQLKNYVFSKEVPRLLRAVFEKGGGAMKEEVLITAETYFIALAGCAKDKVLTIRSEIPDDFESEEEIEGDQVESKRGRHILVKERRMNYLTELLGFIDQNLLLSCVEPLRVDRVESIRSGVIDSVLGILRRVVEDAQVPWIFFNIEILSVLEGLVANQSLLVLANPSLLEIKKLSLKIFEEFRKYLSINPMLIVESMFRLGNFHTKEDILSNYKSYKNQSSPIQESENVKEKLRVIGRVASPYSASTSPFSPQEDFWIAENYSAEHVGNIDSFCFLFSIKSGFVRSKDQLELRVRTLGLDGSEEKRKTCYQNLAEKHLDDSSLTRSMELKLFYKIRGELKQDTLDLFLNILMDQFAKLAVFRTKIGERKLDFSIVPKDSSQSSILYKFGELLAMFDFIAPKESRSIKFWRVPYYLSVDKLIEKLEGLIDRWESFKQDKHLEDNKPKKTNLIIKRPKAEKASENHKDNSNEVIVKERRKREIDEESDMPIDLNSVDDKLSLDEPDKVNRHHNRSENLLYLITGDRAQEDQPKPKRKLVRLGG